MLGESLCLEDTRGTYADWPLARDGVELIRRSTPLEEGTVIRFGK